MDIPTVPTSSLEPGDLFKTVSGHIYVKVDTDDLLKSHGIKMTKPYAAMCLDTGKFFNIDTPEVVLLENPWVDK